MIFLRGKALKNLLVVSITRKISTESVLVEPIPLRQILFRPIGIELAQPCGVLVQRALNAGLLINVTSDRVIRLLPALIITAEEADDVVDRLLPLVQDFLRECA